MRTEANAEFVRCNTMWIADIYDRAEMDSFQIYQDDTTGNSWLELKKHIEESEDRCIKRLSVRFRDHWETTPEDKEGYFCVRSIIGNPLGYNQHFLRTGYLENGKVYVTEWILPELIPFVKEEFDPDQEFIREGLIYNG